MRTWREKLQAFAMAVTFAEAGEWDTAHSFLPKPREKLEERDTATRKRPQPRLRKPSYRL